MAQGLLLALLWPALQAQAADPPPRTVRVGVYDNAPKISLSPSGQPSGILGDVLMAVAARERWDMVVVPCEWQACLDALDQGDILALVNLRPAQ